MDFWWYLLVSKREQPSSHLAAGDMLHNPKYLHLVPTNLLVASQHGTLAISSIYLQPGIAGAQKLHLSCLKFYKLKTMLMNVRSRMYYFLWNYPTKLSFWYSTKWEKKKPHKSIDGKASYVRNPIIQLNNYYHLYASGKELNFQVEVLSFDKDKYPEEWPWGLVQVKHYICTKPWAAHLAEWWASRNCDKIHRLRREEERRKEEDNSNSPHPSDI